jgi:hypothetical protein
MGIVVYTVAGNVHGGDDLVHYQHSYESVNELPVRDRAQAGIEREKITLTEARDLRAATSSVITVREVTEVRVEMHGSLAKRRRESDACLEVERPSPAESLKRRQYRRVADTLALP